MFTIDTETGFDQVVFITSSYGLGETVVQGAVNPDEFYVHKPTLARRASFPIIRRVLGSKLHPHGVRQCRRRRPRAGKPGDEWWKRRRSSATAIRWPMPMSRNSRSYALIIERHYGRPMDIEWGKDGLDGSSSTCCRRGRRR